MILWKFAYTILHCSYLNLVRRNFIFIDISLWIRRCSNGSYKFDSFEDVSHLYTLDSRWSACSSSLARSVTQWLASCFRTLKAAEQVTNSSRSVSKRSIISFLLFAKPFSYLLLLSFALLIFAVRVASSNSFRKSACKMVLIARTLMSISIE